MSTIGIVMNENWRELLDLPEERKTNKDQQ
jgi:hypothetical protein